MKLTKRQKDFCKEYVKNGYNGAKAYRTVYDTDNVDTCKGGAWSLLRRPHIVDYISQVEESYKIAGLETGLDRKSLTKLLAEIIAGEEQIQEDGSVKRIRTTKVSDILNAITLYAKLSGEITDKRRIELDDKRDDDVDISKLSKEERAELEKKLLNELKR